MILLSICICSLRKRAPSLGLLKNHLEKQRAEFPDQVEILIETDNGELPTGTKRNTLYRKAKGKYVCSVDDDDWVSPFYIEEILKAIQADPDAVAINGTMTQNGQHVATWDISRFNPYMTARLNRRIHYLRFHNHLSPIRREIAILFPFPDIKFAEDYAFATAIHDAKVIKTEVKVKRALYEYRFKSQKKHSQ